MGEWEHLVKWLKWYCHPSRKFEIQTVEWTLTQIASELSYDKEKEESGPRADDRIYPPTTFQGEQQ